MSLSEELRGLIERSKDSFDEIVAATEINPLALRAFLEGDHALLFSDVEALADYFGIRFTRPNVAWIRRGPQARKPRSSTPPKVPDDEAIIPFPSEGL